MSGNSWYRRLMPKHRSELETATTKLRNHLRWDPRQVAEIHRLYARYIEVGRPFPLDLEEHSLRLILKFIRPDDYRAALRLISVLRAQKKTVSPDLEKLAGSGLVQSPEQAAASVRGDISQDVERTPLQTLPLHHRLSFVVGLPKSASRMMVSSMAAMHPDSRFRKAAVLPYSTGFVGIDATSELRYDGLANFKDGGVAHTHMGATTPTRHALARLGLGHIITVRHPADHLAALYCHIRRIALTALASPEIREPLEARPLPDPLSPASYGVEDGPSHLSFHPVIFPTDARFFLPDVSLDDTISHMIAGGYLYHALQWIVSWQLLRVRNASTIIRYEDFVSNPRDALSTVNAAVFGKDSEEAVTRGLDAISAKGRYVQDDPNVYLRGPTSSSGAWQKYLSPHNRKLYNETCSQFLASHPYGHLLRELYHDIFVPLGV